MTNIQRTTLSVIGVALFGIAGFLLGLNQQPQCPQCPEPSDTTACLCPDGSNPPQALLTTAVVRAMVGKYEQTQLKSIESHPPFYQNTLLKDDAQAIWFDLEALKHFLYQIESNVDRLNTRDVKPGLGVRIYYAAYPNKDQVESKTFKEDENFKLKGDDQDLHTLIMIPTISVNGVISDFNPLDGKTYSGFDGMLQDDYEIMCFGPGNRVQTSARNHGTLYPPGNTTGASFIGQ